MSFINLRKFRGILYHNLCLLPDLEGHLWVFLKSVKSLVSLYSYPYLKLIGHHLSLFAFDNLKFLRHLHTIVHLTPLNTLKHPNLFVLFKSLLFRPHNSSGELESIKLLLDPLLLPHKPLQLLVFLVALNILAPHMSLIPLKLWGLVSEEA